MSIKQDELDAMRRDMLEEIHIRRYDDAFEDMMLERYGEMVQSFVADCVLYDRGNDVYDWFVQMLEK